MADDLVLASDVIDLDKDNNVVVVGKEGEALPSKLKDLEEEYINAGILVPKKYKDVMDDPVLRPMMATSTMSVQDVATMTKQDISNLRAVAEASQQPQ
jgi:hypothetical protein